MKKLFVLFAFVLMTGFAASASAGDLFSEDFESYTAGDQVIADLGWTDPKGNGSNAGEIRDGGLQYLTLDGGDELAGYYYNGGTKKVNLFNGRKPVMPAVTPTNTFYISILVGHDNPVGDSEWFFKSYGDSNEWNTFFVLKENTPTQKVETRLGNSANPGTPLASPIPNPGTMHLVTEIAVSGGVPTTIKTWLNPDPSAPLGAPNDSQANGGNGTLAEFSDMMWQFQHSTLWGDEFLYTDTWSDIQAKFVVANAGDANRDTLVDAGDIGTLLSNFGTGTKWSEADFNDDDLVDASDVGDILTNFTGDPGPAPAGSVIAEYDTTTGQIIVSVDGVQNWLIEAADGSAVMTGDPANLPGAGGLVTDNDFRVGESNFGGPFSYTDLDLGNVAITGLVQGDLIAKWQTGFGAPTETVEVVVIPEPASMMLLGLGGLLVLRRRRAA